MDVPVGYVSLRNIFSHMRDFYCLRERPYHSVSGRCNKRAPGRRHRSIGELFLHVFSRVQCVEYTDTVRRSQKDLGCQVGLEGAASETALLDD